MVRAAEPAVHQFAATVTLGQYDTAEFEARTFIAYVPAVAYVLDAVEPVPTLAPSDATHVYGPVAPFAGLALYVALPPGTTLVEETLHETDAEGPGGVGSVTVIAVHAPQLLFSSDSVMDPSHAASLSAHARTYHVPSEPNV
jgi:hypothetical protein